MIRVEIPNLEEIIRQLPDAKSAKTVLVRSINRALITGRSEASKKVRQEYILKAAKITEVTRITKANTATLSGRINWNAPMTNLKNFKVKAPKQNPTKKKLQAAIVKGKMVTYNGAFGGPNGQVFKRVTKDRLPIKPVYGPSIAQLMRSDKVTAHTSLKAHEMLMKRISHEIGRMS